MFRIQLALFLYLDIYNNRLNYMTITIIENQANFNLAINTPNILTDTQLEVFSPYSNTVLFDLPATLIESNARFSLFTVAIPTDFWNNHFNGMYTYKVYFGAETYDSGSFKLVTQPGGDMGTVQHITSNENREAQVVYRSNY